MPKKIRGKKSSFVTENSSQQERRAVPVKKSTPRKKATRVSLKKPNDARSKVLTLEDQTDSIRDELNERWDELWEQRRRAEVILAEYQDSIMQRADVTGVHVGLRRQAKLVVFPLEFCIRIHVATKLVEGHPLLAQGSLLPSAIDGVRVDVLQRNYQLALGPRDRAASMIGGVAIANRNSPNNWGTMGMKVLSGARSVYLTNQHIAGNPIAGQDEVIQPPLDLNSAATDRLIGRVAKSVRNRLIDAAIVTPVGNRPFEAGIHSVGNTILLGTLTTVDERFTEAFFIGAASNDQPRPLGIVKSVNSTIDIGGFGVMTNQIVVESRTGLDLIQGGDSGSILLVRRGSNIFQAVGLIHAEANAQAASNGATISGQDTYRAIIACHLNLVVSQLGIRLN